LGNEINRCRIMFKYAYDAGLIDRPVRYGQVFRRPSRKSMRIERQRRQREHGRRMFEAADLRRIIEAATMPMRAMILLGANGGLGGTDVSELTIFSVDLNERWLDFPRPKTGRERRVPLWEETVSAIEKAVAERPLPAEVAYENRVFLTRTGRPYVRVGESGAVRNSVSEEFAKLLRRLQLKRHGVNFYALRHTFETIAGDSLDQVAVDAIMGHADHSMAGLYRERISDERLEAVVRHMHEWLWPLG